jgi:DDE superfamily endonuclease
VIAEVARDHPEAERLEVWFLDEARVGQTGRVCRRWFERGMRPRGVRDLRHEATYLFGAVCPERDTGVALVLPTVSAAAMQAMLAELGQAVAPGAHAVVLMDRAGWHTARELDLPANLTPVFLPASRAERHRAGLALSPRALPLPSSLAQLRRHPRCLLRRVERPPQRARSHPFPLRPRLGHTGQFLMGLV